jgi:hypothetical protein
MRLRNACRQVVRAQFTEDDARLQRALRRYHHSIETYATRKHDSP